MKRTILIITTILTFCLIIFAASGDLDTSFGTGGKVTTDFGSISEQGRAVAIDANGKIVVAGYTQIRLPYNFAVARYNADGSLDTSFGTGGKVTTAFASVAQGTAIAIDANGKIVVAGFANNGSNYDFAVARYNVNGSLDASFGTGGKVMTDFSSGIDYGYAVAIDDNGKIVVAGSAQIGSTDDFAAVRYNANGSLDTSFGIGGKVTTDFSSSIDVGNAIAIDANGKIVVAGYIQIGLIYNFAVARYNADGSLDTSFGTGGKVTTDFSSSVAQGTAIAIDANGKIVVAGAAFIRSTDDFAVVRYNADGSLDASFGAGGKVTTAFGSGSDEGTAIAIDAKGKIVVAGYTETGSTYDFAVARYNADGSLDASFGTGGKVTTDFSSGIDAGFAVAIDAKGKIVVAGQASNASNYDFGVARYESLAPVAARLSVTGRVRTPNGKGLSNSFVTLTDTSGNQRLARTTAFGYFHFEDVSAGETYIVQVNSKRYRFAPQVLSINHNITDVELTGEYIFGSPR